MGWMVTFRMSAASRRNFQQSCLRFVNGLLLQCAKSRVCRGTRGRKLLGQPLQKCLRLLHLREFLARVDYGLQLRARAGIVTRAD